MEFINRIPDLLSLAFVVILQFLGFIAAAHAIINKRDPKSSICWIGVILLSPGIGAVLYWLFGINRIKRRAQKKCPTGKKHVLDPPQDSGAWLSFVENFPKSMKRLVQFTDRTVNRPIFTGNSVKVLSNGEEFFPEIVAAIGGATKHILICTYIFENDDMGKRIAAALRNAGERGVIVRVLIDGVGARYSIPTIFRELKGKNIIAERYNRSFLPWKFHYAQLRNHRKLIIIDGSTCFIGGANITDTHNITRHAQKKAVQDIHFKIQGPVVRDLQNIFFDDWQFSHGEDLAKVCSSIEIEPCGQTFIRSIPDGPDESIHKMRRAILGAISTAEESITIVTPYFIPDLTIVSALGIAAMKGVRVDIVLPAVNNHRMVHWACLASLRQILEKECNVYFSPLPFDHSKLFIVDGIWSLIGSTNWDARSLRLNFELNIECYDTELGSLLLNKVEAKIAASKKMLSNDLENRPVLLKFRDGIARLFTPYL